MVNNYKRKSDRQSWREEDMKNAIEKVATREMGLNKAAATFNVPKTTLIRRLSKYESTKDLTIATEKKMGRYQKIFSVDQERELASHVKNMESRFFGLTTKDLRRLAYELAEQNNLQHNFCHETKMAGRIWLENFLKRNPDLSLRKPEPTSAARASGFNQVQVKRFFDLLTDLITKHKLTPDRIFNVDETGMTTVPKSMPRILGTKGKKQVGLLTSAERGQLVTVVCRFGADGSYMPPIFVYPRKRMKPELMLNAPRGSSAFCHESGWIQKDIFTEWFKKFIKFSRASVDNPVLLLLDGHASHTKNLDIIELGRINGVHVLSFPPHCTHRLQPLDVGFMKPFSTYYTEAANNWLRFNPGKVITQFQVAELVDKAFQKAATLSNAYNAFRATGIWPLNPDVFTEADFLAAATTDIEMPEETPRDNEHGPSLIRPEEAPPIDELGLSVTNDHAALQINITPPLVNDEAITAQPGTSSNEGVTEPLLSITCNESFSKKYLTNNDEQQPSTSTSFFIAPKDIMPVPKTTKRTRPNIKRGKTVEITSSPYREELEATKKAQEMKENAKLVKQNLFTEKKGKGKQTNTQKGKGKGKSTKKNTQKKRKDSSSEDEEDVRCFYCSHLFSESTEGWVQCPACSLWAHCSCAGVEDDDEDVRFVCERCDDE
ncbi:uncharacterized protein [Maniola hyperantus]